MPMAHPPHPGAIVRAECLEPLGLTVTDGARVLGVARQTLNNLVNAQSAISPKMAIRLEKAFGMSADLWTRLQAAYDLADARRHATRITVARYRPARHRAS